MIPSKDEPFSELNGNPACGLNGLGTFINHKHVKKLILQFRVYVLAKGLVSGRGERTANYVSMGQYFVNLI